MNKKYSSVGLVFAAAVALGVVQGIRVTHLRESELFYRWTIGAANQFRLFGSFTTGLEADEATQMKDQELFDDVSAVFEADPQLPNIPLAKDDYTTEGKPYGKLVRLVQDSTEGSSQWDPLIWDMARSPKLAAPRAQFLQFLRQRRLSSAGSQFGTGDIYSPEGTMVNLSNLFFGFRKMAANLIWLQLDKYWHMGMLHRMVPLMKMAVALDPTFTDAYLLGAWHLAYNATAHLPQTPEHLKTYYPRYKARLGEKETYYYQAVEFLKDGIRKNPRNYKLYFDLGFAVYELKLVDHANAVKYLSEAIRQRHDRWVPRTLYRCMQYNGQYEEALAGWKDYIEKFPDNVVAPRFIKMNEALIQERDGEKALSKAEAAQADAEAQAARREAERYFDQARAIYKEIIEIEDERGDPFSSSRIIYMDARKRLEEKRYYEAIALLEQARWLNSQFFDVFSEKIVEIKLKAGIPLTLSERKSEIVKEEKAKFLAAVTRVINGRTYELRDDEWCQAEYDSQKTDTLSSKSEQLASLKQRHPELDEILALGSQGSAVVFQLGDTWYRFQP